MVPRFPETVRAEESMRRAFLALAALLASSTALRLPRPSSPPQPTRRSFLLAAPALLALPPQVRAAATGGGFQDSQFTSIGGGPPKLVNVPALTKGEPSPQELQRLVLGYQRLQYLLANWDKETTVCIKGCVGKYESCGCIRDPLVVQAYMGYKSMNDPLFKAGDLMLRASSLIESDAEFERYNAAMELWNRKAEAGNVMAYVSSWGEANPGGGQDEIARYLEKSRKEVVDSANLLKTILDCLKIPV